MTLKKQAPNKNLKIRPPIVVVLGHVDHGKTTLLDYIRKANVAEKESGGITQHIGAYQIEYNKKIITFIDTPGHEAFSQMRSRGAKVADIAILVIAAEEGIKPQTKEVISHIKEYKISVVVALNKIDKTTANPEKVIGELAKEGIVVESQGGKIPLVSVSAKTGQGVDELLEILLLVAEMEELKADFQKPGSGVVIESYLNAKRGPTAVFLIRKGTLKQGDPVSCGENYGKIKILEDFQKNPIKKAEPSISAIVLGLNGAPIVGEQFNVEQSEGIAQEKAQAYKEEHKGKKEPESVEELKNKKTLTLILKTDVLGSLEAIKGTIDNIPQKEVVVNIIKSKAGDISESDIKLAQSTGATIFGFRIKVSNFIFSLAKRQGVKIKIFDVIYELVEEIRRTLTKLLEPETVKEKLGRMKVLIIFKKEKAKMIIGGKVIFGKIENKVKTDVIRNEEKIGEGKITQLQQNKKNIGEVEKGKEAGILFEGEPIVEQGDILEAYKQVQKKREL